MPLLDPRSGPSYGAIEQQNGNGNMEEEQNQLLQNGYETDDGELSSVEASDEAQEGILKIEAINMTWTPRSLMIAYVRFVCGLQRGFSRFHHIFSS